MFNHMDAWSQIIGALCMLSFGLASVISAGADEENNNNNSQPRRRPKNFRGLVARYKRTTRYMEHLTPEMITGPAPEMASTLEERMALYNRVQELLAELQNNPRAAIKQMITIDLPWNVLERHPNINIRRRAWLPNHVAELVYGFLDHVTSSLHVAIIPTFDAHGNVIDAHFYVADGWHRRTAAIQRNFAVENVWFDLPCQVSVCTTIAKAAQIFAAQNSDKKNAKTSPVEDWRGEVVSEEPMALRIVRMCADYNLDATCETCATGWPFITFGNAIRSMLEDPKVGEDVVRCVLERYGDANLLGLRGPKPENGINVLTSGFFIGFCRFVAMFERPGYVTKAAIIRMLSDTRFPLQLHFADRSLSEKEIAELLNINVERKNDEKTRQFKIVAALAKVYEEYVAKPRSRTPGLWADCPNEIRSLFHTIRHEEDEQRRVQRVAQMHRALVRMGMEPSFEVQVSRTPVSSPASNQPVRPITR